MKLSTEILKLAWKTIEANKANGGIDEETIPTFKQRETELLALIHDKLAQQSYQPQPYLHIKIPKDKLSSRSIGMACINDKIVQQAILMQLEDKIEAAFVDTSYAYRKDKGPYKALQRIKHYIKTENKQWLIKCDIDNFFDAIQHQRLEKLLQPYLPNTYFLELIMLFCKMGYVSSSMKWQDRNAGVPQGAILSPLLSNLYLTSLDQRMQQRKIAYVRYADDFVMFANSKAEAESILKDTVAYIHTKLHLKLNEGYAVKPLSNGFKYLGVWVNENGFSLQNEKIESIKLKINKAIFSSKFPQKYLETINGIKNYYAKIVSHNLLYELDEYQKTSFTQKIKAQKNIRTKKEINLLLQPLLFITDIFAQNEIFHKNQQCNIIYESLSSKFAIDAAAILRKRKREYELKEFENHEIIITGFGKSIGMAKNHCTVKQDGKLIQKVPLLNVEHISIQTDACSISAALINYCAEKNIPIDFTDFSGEPTARLFSAMNDTYQLWHLQFLHLFNTEAQQVACALIIAKINNQKKLIRYFSKYGKKHILELAPALQQSLECLDQCIEKIKNRNIHQLDELRQKLINIEAQASLAYWEIVRIFLDEETNFDNRIRKGATDLVNCLLNYGYSILYRHVWTSILRQGLHPSFSYIHQAKKFEGTLVFDFIEPFRQPIVDRAVISLINRKTTLEVKNGKLTDDTKKKLIIAVNDRLRRYDTYLGERKTMFNIINKQAQHYVQYLHDDCKKFKPYQMSKW